MDLLSVLVGCPEKLGKESCPSLPEKLAKKGYNEGEIRVLSYRLVYNYCQQ